MVKRKERGGGRGVLEYFHDMKLVKKWIHALNFIKRGKWYTRHTLSPDRSIPHHLDLNLTLINFIFC